MYLNQNSMYSVRYLFEEMKKLAKYSSLTVIVTGEQRDTFDLELYLPTYLSRPC